MNGERLGTYHGHVGAIWTVDVDSTTTFLASGAADNTIRLWDVKTGKLLKTWEFGSAIKRVEFSPDGRQLLGVTEKRVGHLSTIVVYDINPDPEGPQTEEQALRIVCEDSKATVAGFSFLAKYIISGHEDGTVTQWDGKVSQSGANSGTVTDQRRPANTSIRWRCTNQTCKSRTCNGHQIGPTSSHRPKTNPQKLVTSNFQLCTTY